MGLQSLNCIDNCVSRSTLHRTFFWLAELKLMAVRKYGCSGTGPHQDLNEASSCLYSFIIHQAYLTHLSYRPHLMSTAVKMTMGSQQGLSIDCITSASYHINGRTDPVSVYLIELLAHLTMHFSVFTQALAFAVFVSAEDLSTSCKDFYLDQSASYALFAQCTIDTGQQVEASLDLDVCIANDEGQLVVSIRLFSCLGSRESSK